VLDQWSSIDNIKLQWTSEGISNCELWSWKD